MLHIISASRRTDLPRLFTKELSAWMRQGWVSVRNPFNQNERKVSILPEAVHTLVLWSKDFTRVLNNKDSILDKIQEYKQVYFHFTITGFGGTIIEPGILTYQEAILQFEKLVKIANNPMRINWRFDPLVYCQIEEKAVDNTKYFEAIAKSASYAGIKTVTISLCHWYSKSIKRAEYYGIKKIIPSEKKIKEIAEDLLEKTNKYGLKISSCCTPEVIPYGISKAKCIDAQLLSDLHPQRLKSSLNKDTGQRKECGCSKSIDIGSYGLSCENGCVYCYANPKYKKHPS
ncbi:DUF1848 family protein [candidate division FCPU426 bacterium]|nr:DUF1848 family protein [candidate division FCPU426 bacterium]